MRNTLTLIGIIFIIVGGLSLAYQGFTYTDREQVAQIGSLKVTADTEKSIHFPPILGGIAIVAGVVLVIAGRRGGGK